MTKRLRVGRHLAVLVCGMFAWASLPLSAARPALAASIDGIEMPPVMRAGGMDLRLNGVGMRDYSLFNIHIYAAGLYLAQPSSDWLAILLSDSPKLLVIHFVHDVSAAQSRDAWSSGFKTNCLSPCHLRGDEVLQFLQKVPDFRRGDESTLLFVHDTAEIAVNGRPMGTVTDGEFARTILATFIGIDPPTQALKRGLLGVGG